VDFLSRAETVNSPQREILTRLIELGLTSCVHILIAPKPPIEVDDVFRSASGALIDFGGRPCLVTNKHVVDAYRELSAVRPTVFELADIGIDPKVRLYSEDEGVDLAVIRLDGLRIRVDRGALTDVPKLQLYHRDEWPATGPQVGDQVFFAGWPEVGRNVDVEEREAVFTPYCFTGIEIHSVPDDQFTMRFERERFQGIMGWETAAQLAERNLSGLSGTPIFRDTSLSGGLVPDLIGFVKQYSCEYDYLIATSALNLQPDGRVKRHRP
jgi:hypothetical protein